MTHEADAATPAQPSPANQVKPAKPIKPKPTLLDLLRRRARLRQYYALLAAMLMFGIIGLGFYLFAAIGTERKDSAAIALAKEREAINEFMKNLNSKSRELQILAAKIKTRSDIDELIAQPFGERACIGFSIATGYPIELPEGGLTKDMQAQLISKLLLARLPKFLKGEYRLKGDDLGLCLEKMPPDLLSPPPKDAVTPAALEADIKVIRTQAADLGYEVVESVEKDRQYLSSDDFRTEYSQKMHNDAFNPANDAPKYYEYSLPIAFDSSYYPLLAKKVATTEAAEGAPLKDAPTSAVSLYGVPEILSRITLVVLIVLVIQTVVSVFRYTMRLSGFYDARADALQIRDELKLTDATETSFAQLVATLSPDAYDFGRMPKSPVEYAVEIAKAVIERTGKPTA